MSTNNLLIYQKNFKTIHEIFHISHVFPIFAGPCAIESIEQMEIVADFLVKKGIKFIRGGAYKPRTSPYSFQGLEIEGLKMLGNIRKKYNLLTVSEIIDPRDVEKGLEYTDIIQIGSRNMHNYSLLKEVGKTKHPILLKRGMMSTIKEFLLAVEYIVSNGNDNIILCERGIRTFEDSTRFTLDISCIAIIVQETSLPIIADLSHSLGRKDIIVNIAKAVVAAGACGIMLEMCPSPSIALSDAGQQLNFDEFNIILNNLFTSGTNVIKTNRGLSIK
jgi:3-deoxy-7-phosphoheptulonate synthase